MKHIETMYELFEFGGKKEGDDFTEQLLNIVENEKIKITKNPNTHEYYGYIFEVDGIEYEIDETIITLGYSEYYLFYRKEGQSKYEAPYKIAISRKLYKRIEKLYKEYSKSERISNLPDISDVGRAARKYNL